MDAEPYLARIGYSGSREPTKETLRQLHRRHLLSVPFENLDIHLGHPIELSVSAFYDKIVGRRRGGFCYELNGLFGWLLEQLGFPVFFLSARVFSGTTPGPEFDHSVLLIDMKERLLADVGFGDLFLEPLLLDSGEEQTEPGGSYRFTGSAPERVLQRRTGSNWKSQYRFSLVPRSLSDFTAMCRHHQTSAASHFTQNSICTLATANGRITLENDQLITTEGKRRVKRKIKSEEAYRSLLKSRFGVSLEKEEPVDRLMLPGSSSKSP